MSPIISIILPFAGSILKSILERKFGDDNLFNDVVDGITEKFGENGEHYDGPAIRDQVVEFEENQLPEILEKWNINQKQMLESIQEEANSGFSFNRSWRPAIMWLIGATAFHYLLVWPWLSVFGLTIAVFVTFAEFLSFATIFAGLYMGGHTVKEGLKLWMSRR